MKKIEYPDDFFIVIGEKDQENWLILDRAKDIVSNDSNMMAIWFHLGQGMPSSHVILIAPKNTETPTMIETAAMACKKHSKAKKASNVPVIYCPVQEVVKNQKGKAGSVLTTGKSMKIIKV